jgi:hypothetical protein
VVLGAALCIGCGGADNTPTGPGPVPVEQLSEAVKITKAVWDGNRTLTLSIEGDLAKAADLTPAIVWGYTRHSLPTETFEISLPSGRKLKIGTLTPVILEVPTLSEPVPTVIHQISFIPFSDATDANKGGVLEYVATTLKSSRDPQAFALALPVYRARGRMDWFAAPVDNLRPMLVILVPSPYKGAQLPATFHFGVEDLPPDPPAGKTK